MNWKLLTISLIVISLIVLGIWWKNKGNLPEEKTINIGAIIPLSGDLAVYGNPAKQGIELAVNEIKKSYKVSVSIVFEDSKGEGKTAVNSIIKLIATDNVSYIIGDLLSSTTLSMAPQANKNKKLLISPTASTSDLNKFGEYSFSIYPSEVDEGEAIAELAKGLKYGRIGIIYENAPSALGMAESFKKKFGSLVFEEKIESNEKDFKYLASRLKRKSFQAILLITYLEPAKKIIKSLKEQNIATNYLAQSSLYDPAFVSYLKGLLGKNKLYLTGGYYNQDREDNFSKSFSETYKAKFSTIPNMFAAQSYDATIIGFKLYNELQKGKSIEKIKQGFTHTGISGTFSFNKSKRRGFGFYEIKDTGIISILK